MHITRVNPQKLRVNSILPSCVTEKLTQNSHVLVFMHKIPMCFIFPCMKSPLPLNIEGVLCTFFVIRGDLVHII